MVDVAVTRARRRFIVNEALAQCAVAGIVVAAGVALILTVGTRWLEWWTLGPLTLAAAAYSLLAFRRSIPSRYAAAIRLDRAAGLHDALSTALHFHTEPEPFAQAQRRHAEETACHLDVNAALPLTVPRSLYGLAACLAAVVALLAVRYGAAHTLDLRAPITEAFFEDQAAHRAVNKPVDEREALRRRNLQSAESLLAKMGVPVNPEEAGNQQALDHAIDQALAPPANGASDKGQKSDTSGKAENGRGGNTGEQPPGDPMDEKSAMNPPDGKKESGADKDSPKGGGDSSSLLSKLKDAVSNLLSKASPKPDAGGQKSSAQQQDQMAKSSKGKADKASGKGREGESSADAQEGQQDGDSKDGQDAQSKSSSKNAQQAGQSGSGVGNQDGSKDLKAAEQLRAMGKISEIIGKRAASVTGETMVEVQSGNQKLSTAYSNKAAGHREAGGDVSRDEIPVAMQPYVREYFERVRKGAGTGERTVPATAPK